MPYVPPRGIVSVDQLSALLMVEATHHIHGEQCLCGFKSFVSRDRTKHIMDVTLAALRGES